ncbi:MAG: NADH-quinone oxidoreductase subunit M [Ardenticatenales bacterium]
MTLTSNILTLITFLPLVGMIILMLLRDDRVIKQTAIYWSLLPLALSTYLWWMYDKAAGGFQFEQFAPWIRLGDQFTINFHVGVDGFSVPLIFLTCLLTTISLWYSAGVIQMRVKEYFALFMLLQAGMLGVFVSLDLFMFYVFFEVGLVPMYFLIGIWGGPRREYAAIKFFLYTLAGSVLMLLSLISVVYNTGSFSLVRGDMVSKFVSPAAAIPFLSNPTGTAATLAFVGFLVAMLIKMPSFPFHTWLPDAHVEAPTAGSIILAGVLLKLGTYGMVRVVMPLFPSAFRAMAIPIGFLAFTSIVYGALVAMAQWDFKKLIAYSSVNHMGYVLLGLTASVVAVTAAKDGDAQTAANILQARQAGIDGAVMQMFAHGIITGALFLLVGLIYDTRTHERDFRKLGGGLWRTVPRYGTFLIVAAFASLGLPSLAGFVAEFLVFNGAFGVALNGNLPFLVLTGLSVLGIVFTAAFILWKIIQMLLLGPQNETWIGTPDLTRSEMFMLLPLVAFMFIYGLYPKWLLDYIHPTTTQLVTTMDTALSLPAAPDAASAEAPAP